MSEGVQRFHNLVYKYSLTKKTRVFGLIILILMIIDKKQKIKINPQLMLRLTSVNVAKINLVDFLLFK